MSVFVIRAFVKMRDALAADSAMVKRLAQIDSTLFLHGSALRDLYQKLRPLLAPPPEPPPKTAHRIYALKFDIRYSTFGILERADHPPAGLTAKQ